MAKRITAISNHKGGVGKTTTAASMGAALASMGYKVLLVDLDAQANLTSSLLQNEEQERTTYNALKEQTSLPIVEVKENLWLTPSSLDLAGIELELSGAVSREYILKDLLEEVSPNYDFIFLDCPPSLSLIAVNAFVASTDVIIPLTAEALPSNGLTMIQNVMNATRKRLNPTLTLSGIIITRWEGSNLNKMIEEALRDNFGDVVYSTKIRKNVALAEAPLAKQDIFAYSKENSRRGESNGSKDYQALTEEYLQKIGIK